MVIKLTGLAHHHLQDVAESVVPKNLCFIRAEENKYASNGIAFAVYCKGQLIGYVPELKTLREYYKDAQTEEKRFRIQEWGKAVSAVRDQFRLDMDAGITEWKAQICSLLYTDGSAYAEYQEYSDMCQNEPLEAKKWTLQQISVTVDGVLPF